MSITLGASALGRTRELFSMTTCWKWNILDVDVCFGETVTLFARSVEHLHISQAFSQIAAQRHAARGIALRAASNGAVRVGPEKHQ